MNKEYTEDIYSFNELETALIDWFNVFKWDVSIDNENLTSLASLAKFTYFVDWDFSCSNNQITSLEWCPKIVGWKFSCSYNNLSSLFWCPRSIWWEIWHYNNNFVPLEKNWSKYNLYYLWENIFIWKPGINIDNKDIQILINFNNDFNIYKSINTNWDKLREKSQEYYDSFINFTKSTTKLDKQDITDTDVVFNWKKFKRKILGL